MNLLVFLFALLAVVAMAVMPVFANNPMCNEAPQSGGGYKVYEMSAAARAAQRNTNYGSSRNFNSNYGSTGNYNRNFPSTLPRF